LALLLASIGCTPVDAPPTSQKIETSPERPPMIAEPDVTLPSPTACLARYELGSKSVLDEQRSRGGASRWDDFPKRYPAAAIDAATHHAVEAVSAYRIADAPLLWFTPDFRDAVVDSSVLGELTVVDATRLGVDERVELGVLTERGRTQLRGRELTEFLLRSDAIQTYVHIGSTLCLITEVDEPSHYRAELTGEHEYYTNEENHDPLAFSLEIAADRRIVITGLRPTPLPPAVPVPSP
jgi:hypothetical protein